MYTHNAFIRNLSDFFVYALWYCRLLFAFCWRWNFIFIIERKKDSILSSSTSRFRNYTSSFYCLYFFFHFPSITHFPHVCRMNDELEILFICLKALFILLSKKVLLLYCVFNGMSLAFDAQASNEMEIVRALIMCRC